MSTELIAVLVTSVIEIAALGAILYRIHTDNAAIYRKTEADDVALFRQARKIEEVLRQMRDELTRAN